MDPTTLAAIAAALFGGYKSFGGGYNNPAGKANKTLDQIPGQTNQYYQPYADAGKGALGDLQNQYKGLLGGDVYNKIAGDYKESPGYQFQLHQALEAGNNAYAAGGLAGTPSHELQNMGTAQDLAAKDFNQYFQNASGLYGLGLKGEEGLNSQGYDANSSLANLRAQILGQQSSNLFSGETGRNQYTSSGTDDIFKALGFYGNQGGGKK